MSSRVFQILVIVVVFIAGYFIGKKSTPKHISEYDMSYVTFSGGQVKGEDVYKIAGRELMSLEKAAYDLKKHTTEEILKEKVNLPPVSYSMNDIKISPAEIDAVLKERHLARSQVSEKEIANIANNLKLQKAKSEQKEQFDKKIQSTSVKFNIPYPTLPKVKMAKGSAPGRGSFWSPIEVIQFTNYHCGTCALAESHLDELNKKFENKLKIYFRYKGIDPKDSVAFLSAEAGLCANDQNQFWEFHDALTKKPPQAATEIVQIAEELKIKNEKFDDCLKKRVHQKDIELDQTEAMKLPQDSVPYLIINDQVISSLENIDVISDIIEKEL